MYLRSIVSVVFVVCSIVSVVYGYGEPANEHPNWQERANHVLMNAVRMAPTQYVNIYAPNNVPSMSNGILNPNNYSATNPLYFEAALTNAAVAHSTDMANNGCFSHNSCNGNQGTGQAPGDRIKSYYTCSGAWAENIAAGNANPINTLNQWLCDETNGACAADKTSAAGHRTNIMGGSYAVAGVGFAYNANAQYRNYWTQDFGAKACNSPTNPIFGGSHVYWPGDKTKFVANYYVANGAAPSAARVVVDGTSYTMTLESGSDARGTYVYSQNKGTSGCRSYYFEFVNAAGTSRYPDTGFLVTYGEANCLTSFSTAASPTTAPTAAPTSAPTTRAPTAAPTTRAPTSAPTTRAPTTPAPTTRAPTTPAPTTKPSTCGDGICSPNDRENCVNCQEDCPRPCNMCGDGICSIQLQESCRSCPQDCGECVQTSAPTAAPNTNSTSAPTPARTPAPTPAPTPVPVVVIEITSTFTVTITSENISAINVEKVIRGFAAAMGLDDDQIEIRFVRRNATKVRAAEEYDMIVVVKTSTLVSNVNNTLNATVVANNVTATALTQIKTAMANSNSELSTAIKTSGVATVNVDSIQVETESQVVATPRPTFAPEISGVSKQTTTFGVCIVLLLVAMLA